MFEGLSAAALFGALIYLVGEQTIWIRAFLGGVIGAIAFVVIPVSVNWVLDLTRPVVLSINCSSSPFPTKVPEGGLITVQLYPGAGGSSISLREPGSPTSYSGNEFAYRCEIRNQSGKELPALRIRLPVEYRMPKEPTQKNVNHPISLIAPYLDARPERPFVFYIGETRDFSATIKTIEVSYARESSRNRAIRIVNNLINPMQFGAD